MAVSFKGAYFPPEVILMGSRKGQMEGDEFEGLSAAEQFYALAS